MGEYESKSSVGTQVEYFSNIMAGEPLSACYSVCSCDQAISCLKETSGSQYCTNLLQMSDEQNVNSHINFLMKVDVIFM